VQEIYVRTLAHSEQIIYEKGYETDIFFGLFYSCEIIILSNLRFNLLGLRLRTWEMDIKGLVPIL
jgi:hypothetical protein